MSKYVIIGNGVAGVNAAKTLAQGGAQGGITIFAAEAYHYYNRWQLPAFLAGQKPLQDICFYPQDWYDQQGIQVYLGTPVTGINTPERLVTLAGGQQVGYGSLLIAAGGQAFVPPMEGADKRGVFVLRAVDDALALREYASHAQHAIVIGGGLLGLEAAHSLGLLGLEVTVVEFFPRLLPRQLDAQGSALFQELFERLGIEVHTGAATTRILGNAEVSGIELADGTILAGDLILVSAGMRSDVGLAQSAGLAVNRGILVNEHMQTNAPHIHAAGDCAEFNGTIYGIIPAAIEQARVAALQMMGQESELYGGTMPLTTLKVAGIDLTCIGEANLEEGYQLYRFEDKDKGIYRKLVVRASRIVGSVLLGDKANVAPISRLIRGQVDVSGYEEHLGDPGFDFRALVNAATEPQRARYECTICGYVYDPNQGDSEAGVGPNTPFEGLAEGWTCPMCGAVKEMFTRLIAD